MGWVEDDAVFVRAMHPGQRCTPLSVASHAMYERPNPYREYVAGGYVDMSDCVYEAFDERTTRVSGARFVPSPVCKVKVEGAGFVGHRRIAIVGIRDPHTIALIDKAIAWAKSKVVERFGPEGDRYRLYYHHYGRNGVMNRLEPLPAMDPLELCLVIEAVSKDEATAFETCALASRNLFYARLPELKGTAGAAAMMSDEILLGEPGYAWTLNHTIDVDGPRDLFPIRHYTVNAGTLTEVTRS